jgi:DNA-binding transcriptional regulator YiaG
MPSRSSSFTSCAVNSKKPKKRQQQTRLTLVDSTIKLGAMANLKTDRKKLGLRQQEAAAEAGVSLSTWARWERTNDPKGWKALGLPVPRDIEPLVATTTVNISLSPTALAALRKINPGERSAWVSLLIVRAARATSAG